MHGIEFKDVSVEFPIYDARSRSLRHTIGFDLVTKTIRTAMVGGSIETDRSGRVIIKALKNLSFSAGKGDRIGLLGHNGSGKTTLLRTLAGIYEPTSGHLSVRGRVTPLFDLQLGMDPDQTGLENIILRGRMLGLTKQQIQSKIDDVARFTELEEYLLMPIRTYSAGMLLRLAFAVSTAVTPEILLLDEMIGAGDAAFIESAKARLETFIAEAGVVVLASHNLSMLRQWCTKGMLLHHGELLVFGPIEEAIAEYQRIIASN